MLWYASFIPFMPSPLKIRPGLVPCRGNVPRRLARYPPLCRFRRPCMEELGTAYTVAVAGWNKKCLRGVTGHPAVVGFRLLG